DDWSIREELGSHHGSEQVSGCARRHCEARGPEHTPFSLAGVPARARRPDPERARLVRDGGRLSAFGRRALELARSHPTDPRAAELLHRFVELTRRASVHHVADPSMGAVSREAFERLHRDHPRSRWTAQTRHWYR
ncbi:MAG: hypothetical protein KC619_34770, partial [Myxococcales bacterium]|nr:hypothetical protein [Myxococcales bacterium]